MHGRFSDANLFSQTSLNEEKRFRSRLNLSVSQTEQSYDVLDFDGPIPINRVSKLPPSNYVDKELDDEMINYKPLTDYTESKACANKALALSTDILNEVITLFKKKFCISQNAIKLKKACTFNDQKELDALNKFKYGEKKGDEVADEIPAISFMVVSKQESQESKISNETFRSLSSFDKDFQKEEKDEFDWPANNVFNQRMGLAKIQEFVQTHNSVLSCWAKPISVKQEDLSTIYKYMVTWSRRTRRRAVPVVVAVVYFLVIQSDVPTDANKSVQAFYLLEGHYSFEKAVTKNQIPQNDLLKMMQNKIKILRKYPV